MVVEGPSPTEEEALERLVQHRTLAWTSILMAAIIVLVAIGLRGEFLPLLAGLVMTLGLFAFGATDVAEYRIRMIAHLRVAQAPLRPVRSTAFEPTGTCGRCGSPVAAESTLCLRCGAMVA